MPTPEKVTKQESHASSHLDRSADLPELGAIEFPRGGRTEQLLRCAVGRQHASHLALGHTAIEGIACAAGTFETVFWTNPSSGHMPSSSSSTSMY